jgi:hypothetical protein
MAAPRRTTTVLILMRVLTFPTANHRPDHRGALTPDHPTMIPMMIPTRTRFGPPWETKKSMTMSYPIWSQTRFHRPDHHHQDRPDHHHHQDHRHQDHHHQDPGSMWIRHSTRM